MHTATECSELRDTYQLRISRSQSISRDIGEISQQYDELDTNYVGNHSRIIYDLSHGKSTPPSPVEATSTGIAVSGRQIFIDDEDLRARKLKQTNGVNERLQVSEY